MIVLSSQNDDVISLNHYSAHSTFVSWLRNVTYEKIKNGIRYGLCHAKNEPAYVLNSLNANKYTALHLLQALIERDFAYVAYLNDIFSKHNKSSPATLVNWLNSNFKFPQNDIYVAVKNFIDLTNTLSQSYPQNVKQLMVLFSEKYFLAEKCLQNRDFTSLKWLLTNGYNISLIYPRVINALWSSQNIEIIDTILLHTNVKNITVILTLFSSLYSDVKFLQYAIAKGYNVFIENLISKNLTMSCIILSMSIDSKNNQITQLITNMNWKWTCKEYWRERLLHSVAEAGRTDIATILIRNGTAIDSCDEDRVTPLFKTLKSGNLEVIRHFVAAKATYNSSVCGLTLLSSAVSARNVGIVRNLINLGASPLVPDDDGQIAFYKAISKNESAIVKLMRQNIHDIKQISIKGNSPVHYAVLKGSNQILRTLLDEGFDTDFPDENRISPLMTAAVLNDTIKILSLAEYGANMNAKDSAGNTALHKAVQLSSFSVTRVLTVLRAGVNTLNSREESPLHIAVKLGKPDVIDYLVSMGANLSMTAENGGSFLHLAARYGTENSFMSLLSYSFHINYTNNLNETPLYVSVKYNQPTIIQLIAARGGNLREVTLSRRTLLHVAAEYGHIEATNVLLDLGLDQSHLDKNGQSPLTIAILKNNFRLVTEILTKSKTMIFDTQYLILAASNGCLESLKAMKAVWETYGVGIHGVDWRTGCSPLTEAVKANNVEIVEYLISNGADINYKSQNGDTLVHLAAMNNSYDVLKTLMQLGIPVDKPNNNGETPLWLSAKQGHLALMKLLHKNGGDVDIRFGRTPWENGTLLHPASYSGSVEAVLWLISKHLAVDDTDILGETALHIAADQGHEGIVVELLDHGANVDASDLIGLRPLHNAAYRGHYNATRVLVEYGAHVDPLSLNNMTPLHQASSNGHSYIVELLITSGAQTRLQDSNNWTPLIWSAYRGHADVVKKILKYSKFQTHQDKVFLQISKQIAKERRYDIILDILTQIKYNISEHNV